MLHLQVFTRGFYCYLPRAPCLGVLNPGDFFAKLSAKEKVMLKKTAEDISIAFGLLLEYVTEGQAAVRHACAKASLNGSVEQISNYAEILEKIPLWVKQIEVQRSVILEAFRDQAEAPAAGAVKPPNSGLATAPVQASDTGTPIKTYRMTYGGVLAQGAESGSVFVVSADSTVKRATHSSLSKSQRELRALYEGNGTLIPTADPRFLKLTRDLPFRTTSAAAVFVAGCSVSGPREWKLDISSFLKGHRPDGRPGLMN
jgi:hypothetical protein